ncbi:MAG: hypothetical protein RLZZ387_1470 [Chloroflexota bacterium]
MKVPHAPRLITLALFVGFLALYAATAAPSVLSGDSAEFQLAATLLGVAHPTTYPLYTMLAHLTTRLLPFGELAWRVTLLSSLCAALAVALFFLLARRVLGATGPATATALALGLAPGLWNAATLAEVYALLALLMVALGLALSHDRRPTTDEHTASTDGRRLRLPAFIGGLGFSHHGLFAITALPLLAAAVLWAKTKDERPSSPVRRLWSFVPGPSSPVRRPWSLVILALCFIAGLTPWLYPLAQFAAHGPFDGQDYGLPRHYFWGAPRSYGEVLDLMTGGTVRRGIFRTPEPTAALETLRMVGRRLLFEFGPLGTLLGLLGSWALARRERAAFAAAAWVFFSTLGYLLLLGPAVGDAPVFTLPMLLPWALWIGAGVGVVGGWVGGQLHMHLSRHRWFNVQRIAFSVLIALTLAWGGTRYRVSAKQHLWLYREFAQSTLEALPPGAAVIAHWEQGMALQYVRLVEGVRPDVWVDVVEPTDDPWGPRAARRYPERPVYLVGHAGSVAGLPAEPVREGEYASLFRLRRHSEE